ASWAALRVRSKSRRSGLRPGKMRDRRRIMTTRSTEIVELISGANRLRECLVFIGLVLAILEPSRAEACSYPEFIGPRVHPAATLPSNAGGIWVFPGNDAYGSAAYPEALELRVSDEGGELTLESTIV